MITKNNNIIEFNPECIDWGKIRELDKIITPQFDRPKVKIGRIVLDCTQEGEDVYVDGQYVMDFVGYGLEEAIEFLESCFYYSGEELKQKFLS